MYNVVQVDFVVTKGIGSGGGEVGEEGWVGCKEEKGEGGWGVKEGHIEVFLCERVSKEVWNRVFLLEGEILQTREDEETAFTFVPKFLIASLCDLSVSINHCRDILFERAMNLSIHSLALFCRTQFDEPICIWLKALKSLKS
ncbi:hypothetical protein ACFX15_028959 [Malus domestica]